VVVDTFLGRVREITASIVVISAFITVAPASANSSANADIAAPLRAAQAANQSATGAEDEQFRKLFNSWQTYEKTGVPALAAVAAAVGQKGSLGTGISGGVSIPSRTPIEGFRLTSNFGMRVHPVTGGLRGHKGIDLAAAIGTPIYATADGIISKAAWFGGYGLFVSIEHGGDLQTRYGHMSRLNVADGQRVKKGEIIGFVGSTGRSTGPHLHYEVRVKGQAVNPVPYMQNAVVAAADLGAKGG
jgi:murein DD-endopeptidase MepM/ murein hydrolase activator NlpD